MPSLDTMMSYHRLKRAPLDDSEVFSSVKELMDYCDNGARYDGQKVTVIDDYSGKMFKYTIKNGIPIIDMNGSEPIFKDINFYEGPEDTISKGLLIYYSNECGNNWNSIEIFNYSHDFIFDENKLCLINQSDIFKHPFIVYSNGSPIVINKGKSFSYHIELINKEYTTTKEINVKIDICDNSNGDQKFYSINSNCGINIEHKETPVIGDYDYSVLFILVGLSGSISNIIKNALSSEPVPSAVKIYIKADDYYNALNS